MAALTPLNLKNWIDENKHHLKPPIGRRRVWEDQDIHVTVVGGPAQGKDFHVNPTQEFFFQVEGDVTLRVVGRDAKVREVPVRAGEMFLLPANTPHSEVRPAGTIGMVVEHKRPAGEGDALRFYCDHCAAVVYEEEFEPDEDGLRAQDIRELFWSDATMRTCRDCGHIVQPAAGPVQPPAPGKVAEPLPLGGAGKGEPRAAREKAPTRKGAAAGGVAVLTKRKTAPPTRRGR